MTTPKQIGQAELAPLDSLKHFNLVENGLIVTGQPTYDEWREGWLWLKRLDRALPWIVGDMLVYGELSYNGQSAQEFDPDEDAPHHFTYGSLREYRRVAMAFPVSSRLVQLPFTYYQVVASLPIEQALALLQHAKEAGTKREGLRLLATELNGGRIPQLPTRPADRQFELETGNHQLQQRVTELEQTIPLLPATAPPELPYPVAMNLSNLSNHLGELGYSSVTVYQNGDVTWMK